MTKATKFWTKMLRPLPQVALLALLISVPMLAMAHTQDDGAVFLEHIEKQNSGVGFVLLVSLQR